MSSWALAGELRDKGIAVNALWPRTVIATAAMQNLLGGEARMHQARKPDIMADAAYAIFESPSRELTGRFLIDDNFLAERGVTDFDRYRVDPRRAPGAGLLCAGRHPAAAGRSNR